MKKKFIIGLLFLLIVTYGCSQNDKEEGVPLAPEQYRRPENFQSFDYKYSLEDLKTNFSEEVMRDASKQYQKVTIVNDKGKWKPTPGSIDSHQAPEWFNDAKFGMFIDWGPWSVAGWAPKKAEGAMYPDWYELRMDKVPEFIRYHEKNWGKDFMRDDFIPLFTADGYHPQELVEIAKEAGMKYIIPFSKHHGGFCLWPSSYTHRNALKMGPKKDLIAPLVESCKNEGLKFGFYFSIEEWEYPIIGNDDELYCRNWAQKGTLNPINVSSVPYTLDLEKKISGKIAVKDFAKDYLLPQAIEFIDKYDPDIIWYDGDMRSLTAEELYTYEIAAYFYNMAEGRKEVAVNDRYGTKTNQLKQFQQQTKVTQWLRSIRGDFFTNEYGDMEKEAKQTIHAWEECRGISQSFGFNWQDTDDNVISTKDFIDMFVNIVAHGGNLLLIVNLDRQGALPKVQEKRLKEIGNWLNVNGEGIYETRPYEIQNDGIISYTQSKNQKYIYAILSEWPGDEIILNKIHAVDESQVELLGAQETLKWENTNKGLRINLPKQLQNDKNRPCKYAWVLKVKTK